MQILILVAIPSQKPLEAELIRWIFRVLAELLLLIWDRAFYKHWLLVFKLLLWVTRIENAYGGAGADVLKGNSLNNNLMGNAGNDQLQGFGGIDSFSYLGAALIGTNTVAAAFGRDTIADFTVGVDKFVLSKNRLHSDRQCWGSFGKLRQCC